MSFRWLAALLAILAAAAPGVAGFDDDFTGRTLRIDYVHTGTAAEEHFAVAGMRVEGPWPGSRTRLIDDANLGKYIRRG